MAFSLSRIDRLSRAIPGDVTVALLPPRSKPTAATVWLSGTYSAGTDTTTFVFAGPDASSTGAVVVPATADLWKRTVGAVEVDVELVERITVEGASAPLATTTGTPVVYGTGAGGALSGTYPSPGLNETVVDNIVAADLPDPATATGAAARATLVPFWKAAEVVSAGTIRMAPDGKTISRTANGTTRATYDATEQAAWTVTSGSGGSGSLAIQDENGVAITGVTQIDFQGAGVSAAAGTGEVVVTIPGATTDPEVVRDTMAAALTAGQNVTKTVDDAADTITVAVPAALVVVNAGTNLSTARPTGAASVYWKFAAGTVVGTDGANVVNRQPGDLIFVASA